MAILNFFEFNIERDPNINRIFYFFNSGTRLLDGKGLAQNMF